MATSFLTLYRYARRKLGGSTDSNSTLVAKECVNSSIRYLAEKSISHYRERGMINVLASFTSGTVTVDPDATYCSLSSGGSWSSAYSGGMIRIGDTKVAYEATITSNPARITFGESATWGYASQASVTYSLYKFEYALPTDFKEIGDILDETILGRLRWIDSINEFEAYRMQNYSVESTQMDVVCIAERRLMVWPCPSAKQVIPLPYHRFPADMSADTDTMDYPDVGGHLVLVHRAIDWFTAIELGDEVKTDRAKKRLDEQERRTLGYARKNRNSIIELAPAAGRVVQVTKIIGDDD